MKTNVQSLCVFTLESPHFMPVTELLALANQVYTVPVKNPRDVYLSRRITILSKSDWKPCLLHTYLLKCISDQDAHTECGIAHW